MKCDELMKKDVECCAVDASAADVAKTMRDRNIGFVPVCDTHGRAIGTITDRDLAIRMLADRRPYESTKAGDVMSRNVVSCSPEDDLAKAEELMSQHKVSRILCVDRGGHPVGVISLSDVANVERAGHASAVLRSVSQRETHAL